MAFNPFSGISAGAAAGAGAIKGGDSREKSPKNPGGLARDPNEDGLAYPGVTRADGRGGNRGQGGYRMDKPGGQGPIYGDGRPIYGNPPPIFGGPNSGVPMPPNFNYDPNQPHILPMPYPGPNSGVPYPGGRSGEQYPGGPKYPDPDYKGPLMDDGTIPETGNRGLAPDPRTLDRNGNVMFPGQTRQGPGGGFWDNNGGGMHTHDWRGQNDPRYPQGPRPGGPDDPGRWTRPDVVPPFDPNQVINDGWGSEGPGGMTGHNQDPGYWKQLQGGGGSYYPNNVNDMYGGAKRTRSKSGFGNPIGDATGGGPSGGGPMGNFSKTAGPLAANIAPNMIATSGPPAIGGGGGGGGSYGGNSYNGQGGYRVSSIYGG